MNIAHRNDLRRDYKANSHSNLARNLRDRMFRYLKKNPALLQAWQPLYNAIFTWSTNCDRLDDAEIRLYAGDTQAELDRAFQDLNLLLGSYYTNANIVLDQLAQHVGGNGVMAWHPSDPVAMGLLQTLKVGLRATRNVGVTHASHPYADSSSVSGGGHFHVETTPSRPALSVAQLQSQAHALASFLGSAKANGQYTAADMSAIIVGCQRASSRMSDPLVAHYNALAKSVKMTWASPHEITGPLVRLALMCLPQI